MMIPYFDRGEVYVLVGIALVRWSSFKFNTDFFFLFPESGSLLQLIFDGKYEAIFSNSAIRNVFSASSVAEENIESYLEKQILTYLDCSTEIDNVERWKWLFILWKINRGNVWFLQKALFVLYYVS